MDYLKTKLALIRITGSMQSVKKPNFKQVKETEKELDDAAESRKRLAPSPPVLMSGKKARSKSARSDRDETDRTTLDSAN